MWETLKNEIDDDRVANRPKLVPRWMTGEAKHTARMGPTAPFRTRPRLQRLLFQVTESAFTYKIASCGNERASTFGQVRSRVVSSTEKSWSETEIPSLTIIDIDQFTQIHNFA